MGMIRAVRNLNAITQGTMNGAQLETALTTGLGLGEWSQMLTIRGQCQMLAASSTAMTAVAASATAMAAVAASATAMTAVIASPTALAAVIASATAMTAVAASATAMTAVAASSTAMTAVAASATAMTAVAASSTAMTAVAASATAMTAVIASPTALAAVIASPTALAAVIASATAMTAVAASSTAMAAIYAAPTAVTAIAPSAWGVYGPHAALLNLSTTDVNTWINAQGTTARNFTNTGSNRPQFTNGQTIGGYNTLNFERASSQKLDSTAALNRTEYTIFVVHRRDDTNQHGLIGDAASDGIVLTSTASTSVSEASTSSGDFLVNVPAQGTWGISRYRRAGGALMYHSVNGGAESTALTSNLPNFATANMTIGRGFDAQSTGANVFLDGQIAEVIILEQGASINAETTRVTNMLKTKYGL